jgi:hypothetical protein
MKLAILRANGDFRFFAGAHIRIFSARVRKELRRVNAKTDTRTYEVTEFLQMNEP